MRLPCVCCEPLRIPLISFSPSSHSLSLSLSVRKVTPVPTASAGTRAICHWRLAAELVTWCALVGLPSCTNHLAHPLMGTVRLSFTYRQKNQGRFLHCHAVQDEHCEEVLVSVSHSPAASCADSLNMMFPEPVFVTCNQREPPRLR